jgi:D-alanine-D-alanine ligase
MKSLDVLVVYNEPALPADHPDWASEAGVLESVAAVTEALVARGHRVSRFGIGPTLSEFLDTLPRIDRGDVAFNLFEGFAGGGRGEAEIAGLLELAGWRVTGSPAETLALTRDKARTKLLLAGAGLPTPEFELIAADAPIDTQRLGQLLDGGPLIVKPACEDASLGIGRESIVSEHAAMLRQIEETRRRYGPVLVERFIAGREFNAAVAALGEAHVLPLAEVEFRAVCPDAVRIVTYDAKWAAGSADDRSTPVCCPAQVDRATAHRIGQIGLAAFHHAGCRDYARIDLRTDAAGHVYVLEVNSNPDLSPSAGFNRALAAAGIAYDEFVDRLVRNAFATRGTRPGETSTQRVPQ